MFAVAEGLKGTVGMMKEADKIVAQSMAKVALRVKGQRNAVDNLASAIMGRKTDLRRIDTTSYGTFEGEGNPNIRIPLKGMDASQRQVFLGIMGRGLRQAAMAASVFKPADINQPLAPIILVPLVYLSKPQTKLWSIRLSAGKF